MLWTRAGRWGRLALPAVALLSLAVLAAITVRDIEVWKSNVSLWTRVIEVQPHSFGKAYYQRATFLIQEERFQEALPDADQALAIAARKGYPGIHENYAQVARIRGSMGDLDGAIEALGKAIEASGPPFDAAYRFERASLYEATGRGGEARREREAAEREHGGG
jgi:tetratricopeptide (TPR) repeat protein